MAEDILKGGRYGLGDSSSLASGTYKPVGGGGDSFADPEQEQVKGPEAE